MAAPAHGATGRSSPDGNGPRRPFARRGTFSRETIHVWTEWMSGRSTRLRDLLLPVVFALLVHALVAFVLVTLKPRENGSSESSTGTPMNVRVVRGRPPATTGIPVQAPPASAPPRAPSIPQSPQRRTAVTPHVSTVPAAPGEVRPRIPTEATQEAVRPREAPTNRPLVQRAPAVEPTVGVGPPGVDRSLASLLPNGHKGMLDNARRTGATMGDGPVAGDIPEPEFHPEDHAVTKPKIIVREYPFAAFIAGFNTRFAEAWGGTRVLPTDSSFTGTAGEIIEYDLVINLDGSLRTIVNVTSKQQPARDFAGPDRLFEDVVKNLFPYPIPMRLARDPLIIRKRIQYVGTRYYLF